MEKSKPASRKDKKKTDRWEKKDRDLDAADVANFLAATGYELRLSVEPHHPDKYNLLALDPIVATTSFVQQFDRKFISNEPNPGPAPGPSPTPCPSPAPNIAMMSRGRPKRRNAGAAKPFYEPMLSPSPPKRSPSRLQAILPPDPILSSTPDAYVKGGVQGSYRQPWLASHHSGPRESGGQTRRAGSESTLAPDKMANRPQVTQRKGFWDSSRIRDWISFVLLQPGPDFPGLEPASPPASVCDIEEDYTLVKASRRTSENTLFEETSWWEVVPTGEDFNVSDVLRRRRQRRSPQDSFSPFFRGNA